MIDDYSAVALGAFVAAVIAIGSTVVSDGWPGYKKLKDVKHDPRVVGDAPAHLVLPWIHRVFANAKRWALGVYHGLREKHLQAGPWPRAGEPDPGSTSSCSGSTAGAPRTPPSTACFVQILR